MSCIVFVSTVPCIHKQWSIRSELQFKLLMKMTCDFGTIMVFAQYLIMSKVALYLNVSWREYISSFGHKTVCTGMKYICYRHFRTKEKCLHHRGVSNTVNFSSV